MSTYLSFATFDGTIQPSDSLYAIWFPHVLSLSTILLAISSGAYRVSSVPFNSSYSLADSLTPAGTNTITARVCLLSASTPKESTRSDMYHFGAVLPVSEYSLTTLNLDLTTSGPSLSSDCR